MLGHKSYTSSTQEDDRTTWNAGSCKCKWNRTPINFNAIDTIQQKQKKRMLK